MILKLEVLFSPKKIEYSTLVPSCDVYNNLKKDPLILKNYTTYIYILNISCYILSAVISILSLLTIISTIMIKMVDKQFI